MLEQEHDDVGRILSVQGGNLELRQQELGGGEALGLELQALPEVERVRHLELVQEDVDVVAPVSRVVEEPLGAVGGVEDPLRLVAELLEQVAQGSRLAFVGDEVDVRVVAAKRLTCAVRGSQPDRR